MVRDPLWYNIRLKQVYINYFWRECFECKREFKKERMWSFDASMLERKLFICLECCPMLSDVEKYLKKNFYIKGNLYGI